MAEFPGMTHVALTVTDLAVSVPWYERLLGLKPVLDEDTGSYHHTVYLLPGGMILSLHQHRRPHPGTGGPDRFDEHRMGLDHRSFGVANRAELHACRRGWRSSGSGTEGSSTPTTALGSRSAIRTTSPWRSSRRPAEVRCPSAS
jgi:glyoxylase I family protein